MNPSAIEPDVRPLAGDEGASAGDLGSGVRAGRRVPIDAWTIVEVALTVVVVGVVLWPATAHPGDALVGELDAPYHAWLGWRLAELWGHGQLFTIVIPDAVAPIGLDLRLIDGLLPGAVTAVFNWLTRGNVVLSYNLALAVGVAADVWAGRALAKELSTRRWVWMLSGIAFATAPSLAGSAQAHIAFVYAFALPLLVREAVVVARGDRTVRIGRLAALLVVAYLCSAYHLIFGALAFVIVLAAWPRSAVWTKTNLARLAGATAITLVVLSPFFVARVSYERDERAAGAPDVVRLAESAAFSADAIGVLTPNDGLWIDVPVPKADLGVQLYPALRPAFAGWALLAGAVLVCFATRPARRPLLIASGVLWVLSLGPVLHVAGATIGGNATDPSWFMPYRWLQALPGLGALRAPTRASYALAAVLAGALAVGLDALVDRFADRPWAGRGEVVVGACAAVLVVLSITSPVVTTPVVRSTDQEALLAALRPASGDPTVGGVGRDGVLFVPWGCRLDDPQLLALQAVHHQPNIGCNPPPTATRWFSGIDAWASSPDLAALRCEPSTIDRRTLPFTSRAPALDVARLRRDLGARYVVIDTTLLPPFGCEGPRTNAERLSSGYQTTTDGSWIVIDLARPR